jgi:hypothetical protein
MEEKILEIIDQNLTWDTKGNGTGILDIKCAKEITAHVFEFIEYLSHEWTYIKATKDYVVNYPYLSDNSDYRHFTTEELYQYWIKEVKQ